MENNKKQNLRSTAKSLRYIIGYIWRSSGKRYIVINIFLSVINTIQPLLFTVFPGLLITELTGLRRIYIISAYVLILTTVPLILYLFNVIVNKYLTKIGMKLNIRLETDFYNYISCMDYEMLEMPDIQTVKERSGDTLNGITGAVSQLTALISSFIGLLAISSIIFTLNPFVIVLIILIIYVNSLLTKWLNKQQYLVGQEISKNDRKLWGFSYMLGNFHFAKELRLYDIKDLLIGKVTDNQESTNEFKLNLLKKQNLVGVFSSITNFVQQFILYAYLIFLVLKRGFAIGSMTIYMSAANQFSGSLNNLVNSYMQLAANSLNIQEYIDFVNIPLKQHNSGSMEPHFDDDSVIEFKNVSFKYPGSENYALKDLSITIKGDEKLCIVGANGSGKSTFIKLLTRLYFPTSGEILLNGINIAEYDYKKYQKLFAPVFQDFCRYYFTLGENIVLSSTYNFEKLNYVCETNGLMPLVNKLPKGFDTQVDKWIDEEGFEPSGGEDQRIAIARACYHGGEIYILDEPTAALDPNAEYEIYTQFNRMITDKCAVLITHRLSAVQLADKVAVFDNGSVAEYGTHKELYSKGGIYTEMFDKQAQFYRDEINTDSYS